MFLEDLSNLEEHLSSYNDRHFWNWLIFFVFHELYLQKGQNKHDTWENTKIVIQVVLLMGLIFEIFENYFWWNLFLVKLETFFDFLQKIEDVCGYIKFLKG